MADTRDNADGLVRRLIQQTLVTTSVSSHATKTKDSSLDSKKTNASNPFGYEQEKLESLLIDLIRKA